MVQICIILDLKGGGIPHVPLATRLVLSSASQNGVHYPSCFNVCNNIPRQFMIIINFHLLYVSYNWVIYKFLRLWITLFNNFSFLCRHFNPYKFSTSFIKETFNGRLIIYLLRITIQLLMMESYDIFQRHNNIRLHQNKSSLISKVSFTARFWYLYSSLLMS